jgi:predicted TIM-barrel fold metal-dependent hydrolase
LQFANVSGGIVIADSEPSSPIGTAEECVELFTDCPNIFVVAGISPLINYQSRLKVMEQLLSEKKIVGLKLYPGHEPYFMDDERLILVYELCKSFDVPLLVHTGWDNPQYNHPSYFAKIAERYPNLRIIICHLWWPDINLCFATTSMYENIYYDISSLSYEKEMLGKTHKSLCQIVEHCPHRVILGSDYGMCSITDHINLVLSLPLSKEKKQQILAYNAFEVYGISISKGE